MCRARINSGLKHDQPIHAYFAAVSGFIFVALGAFGAHVLSKSLGAVEMGWIQTGLEYQAFHTLAIFGLAVAMQRRISIWFYWSSVFLALGTVLGTAFGMVAVELFPQYHLEAGTFAIAGMGALLAASIRAPLTGIILVLEMTDNYQLILPMIITGLGATLLAQFTGGKPLYSAILARTLAKQEAEQLARSKAASASENT